MNNPATTSEWIGRRRLRASVDRTLGVKVPKAVFDEAEAYARRKMAFQNEALGLDRGGAIQGQKIDVYFENHDDALQFGRQNVRFYIVND